MNRKDRRQMQKDVKKGKVLASGSVDVNMGSKQKSKMSNEDVNKVMDFVSNYIEKEYGEFGLKIYKRLLKKRDRMIQNNQSVDFLVWLTAEFEKSTDAINNNEDKSKHEKLHINNKIIGIVLTASLPDTGEEK